MSGFAGLLFLPTDGRDVTGRFFGFALPFAMLLASLLDLLWKSLAFGGRVIFGDLRLA